MDKCTYDAVQMIPAAAIHRIMGRKIVGTRQKRDCAKIYGGDGRDRSVFTLSWVDRKSPSFGSRVDLEAGKLWTMFKSQGVLRWKVEGLYQQMLTA